MNHLIAVVPKVQHPKDLQTIYYVLGSICSSDQIPRNTHMLHSLNSKRNFYGFIYYAC